MKLLENSDTIAEIESRLNKYDYLSRHPHPGYPDGKIFTILDDNKRNFLHLFRLPRSEEQSQVLSLVYTHETVLQDHHSEVDSQLGVL